MTYNTSGNQNYQGLQNSSGSYLKNQNQTAPAPRTPRAKKRIKKPTLHQIPTTAVYLHVYFKKLAANYTDKQFFDYILGTSNSTVLNRYEQRGVQIQLIKDPDSFIPDFERSLNTPGAVVVYFGHTVLGRNNRTLGLTPVISKKPKITSRKLVKLLNKSKAKVVLLAGCATDGCVRKVNGDTVVIVTRSGKDRLTNTLQWAPSIKEFLENFIIELKTVGASFIAANTVFKNNSSTDSFELINGDRTLKSF